MKVRFFEDRFMDAIGAGIYAVYVEIDGKTELLYIGESVFVLVRCASHLYEIMKGKGYWGFTKEKIKNPSITLIFKLLSLEADSQKRKTDEKAYIKDKEPVMQSGISDRVKSIEEMISKLESLLNE